MRRVMIFNKILPLLLVIITLTTAHSWKSRIKAGAALIFVPTLLDAGGQVSLPSSAHAASIPLSASQMLQNDYDGDVATLKDVLINLKLNSGLIEEGNYKDLRMRMRGGPITSLRKTCKQLLKILPSVESQEVFNANYSKMIEALNDFDTLITKRIQGTGVPGKGEKDDEMTALLDNVVKQYENMLGAAAAQRE